MSKTDKNSCSPRICNTGAQNTNENGLRACVDWVSFTLKNVQDVQEICDLLGIEFDKFRDCEFGEKGYRDQLRFGNISILYNGKENMGIHVNMSGQGCREFEQHSSMNWSKFFALLLAFDVHFSRLDLAIDDFDNYLSIKTMKRKLRAGEVRSKFKSALEMRKTLIADGSSKGDTIYFGSSQSRIQVRFYDKLLERLEAGKEIMEGVTHWVRSEIQLRDERATKAATIMAFEFEDVGELCKGILKNYITFTIKDKDLNKSRWKIAKFWDKFLNDVEKIPLTQIAPDKTIERSYNWIDKQVNTTLAMLYTAFNGDEEFIQNALEDGYSKMTVEHVDIINRYRSSRNEDVICFKQFEIEREENLKRIEFLKANKKVSSGNEDTQLNEI